MDNISAAFVLPESLSAIRFAFFRCNDFTRPRVNFHVKT
jgi:hypothetical protein